MGSQDEKQANLHSLPNELFLYICSYLDSLFILECLKKVCTRFDNIISDEYVWRKRTKQDYQTTNILFPETESELDNDNSDQPWSCMVYEVEKNKKFLQDVKSVEDNNMQTVVFKDLHISTVNALKLVHDNRLCISVCRDRSIGIWNVADGLSTAVKQIYPAHEGWVWCIDSCKNSNVFYTGAWDSTFKVWSLEDYTLIDTYNCHGTVLSISCTESLVATGLFNSKLLVQDIRLKPTLNSPMVEHVFEKKGVIQGVTIEEHSVYVASANGIVSCYDLRKKNIVKATAPLCIKKDNIMSYSYRNGTIILGDTGSTLTILNKDLEVYVQTMTLFENPWQRKLACIKQNDYDMFVGCQGSLYSFLKSDPLMPLGSVEKESSNYEMTAIEYDFDQVLLHSCDIEGEIVMHKRLQNTLTT